MRFLIEWAEEHWTAVGVVASIVGAVMFSVVLAVGFNIVVTRHDRLHSGAAPATAPASGADARVDARRVAGLN